MGNYNSQYEDYYSSFRKKSKIRYSPYNINGNFLNRGEKKKEGFLVKRITRDLAGTLVLFIIVTGCRLVVTPQTQSIYNFSKRVVDESYDYKVIGQKFNELNFITVQEKLMNTIDQIRSRITGKETILNKIKNNFTLPLEGTETSAFGYRTDPVTKEKSFHAGIDLGVKENTEVKVCFDGKVKDCGDDEQLGKYILIDHGEGIETKYAHLNKIFVKKEDAVKKSQVIAKSGNTGKSTGPHLHFELLYMGENKNPKEYFNIIKK